jgi:glycosyltransferase involved in cell wall biosynthesis
MNHYICAFRGRRDGYQIPLALAEDGRLDQFITDFYSPEWLRSLADRFSPQRRQKILSRLEPGIPEQQVKSLLFTTALEHLRHRLGRSRTATYAVLDQVFSRAAARRANATQSHLLLYAPYAWEAFRANYRHDPQRVLFQFHPHPQRELDILQRDLACFPIVQQSFNEETCQGLSASLQARVSDSWKYADLILCASNFTRESLILAGANPKFCHVIPYGIDLPAPQPITPAQNFHVIFIGSGVQRKGLHHLLYAWQRAMLPPKSQLTLVCRVLDPGLEPLIAQIPSVQLLRGCDRDHLNYLYATASLLAMPSLVEGFGQVYLEALSLGCPVLGSAHSCLPDLGQEPDGIFLVEPGNLEQLTERLEYLATYLPEQVQLRLAARACASRFPWTQFRRTLSRALTV